MLGKLPNYQDVAKDKLVNRTTKSRQHLQSEECFAWPSKWFYNQFWSILYNTAKHVRWAWQMISYNKDFENEKCLKKGQEEFWILPRRWWYELLCGFCNKWSFTVIILQSHILGKDHRILVNLSSHFNLCGVQIWGQLLVIITSRWHISW